MAEPVRIRAQGASPMPPSDPATMSILARLLMARNQDRMVPPGNNPATPPATVQQNPANFAQMANPQAMGVPGINPAAPPVSMPSPGAAIGGMVGEGVGQATRMPSAVPPPAVPAMPPNPAPSLPPANQPSDMPLIALPARAINGPGPGAMGQMAKSTSIWDDFRRMFANGQVPEGYRGVMGEMLKNT